MYFEFNFRWCYVFLLLLTFCAISYASYSYPTKVVGVFKNEKCAPATAALLAVDNFNSDASDSKFEFKNVELDIEDDVVASGIEIYDFNNNIIVTGSSGACEELAVNLANLNNSFLMCYGIPTAKTLDVSQSPVNLYFSQPQPEALITSLFKLVSLLATLVDANSTCKPIAEIVVNPDHAYRQAAMPLFNNLKHDSSKVTVLQPQPQSLEDFLSQVNQKMFGVRIVVAMVDDTEALHLLCHLSKKQRFPQKYLIILTGHYSKYWLDDEHLSSTYKEYVKEVDRYQDERHISHSCEMDELQAAAEGHFHLDISMQNIDLVNSSFVRSTTLMLRKRLELNKEGIRQDFKEAPLAYDSVWAMIQAISRAIEDEGNKTRENQNLNGIVMEKLGEPFIGLSGNISFSNKKRNPGDAVINIRRFEFEKGNYSYTLEGRHFNANSSFVWSRHMVLQGDWNPCWTEQYDSSHLKWIVLIIIPICVLLTLCSLLCIYLACIFSKKNSSSRFNLDPNETRCELK